MSKPNLYDSWVEWCKNNRVIAGLLMLGTVAAGVANLITAVNKILPSADLNSNYLSAQGTIDPFKPPLLPGLLPRNFVLTGTADNVKKGVYLWLLVEIGDRIWPKGGALFVKNGRWTLRSSEKGNPTELDLSLWAANPKANNHLEVWLDHCVETHDCPGWVLPKGMRLLDRLKGLHLASVSGQTFPVAFTLPSKLSVENQLWRLVGRP